MRSLMNDKTGAHPSEGLQLVGSRSIPNIQAEVASQQQPLYSNARDAYYHLDPEASRIIHDQRAQGLHEESHKSGGEYVKAMIFGGLDGILTSFAIVAGAAGGNLGWPSVLVLGFSNIFADALGMGVGEYLSSKAHNEYVLSEKRREEWELRNHRDGEIQEMVDIYTQRGMSESDANMVVNTMAKYEELFVNVMMNEELGLQVPDEDEDDTIKEGFVMFLAFASFGALPLLGYVICPMVDPNLESGELFGLAAGITLTSLFVMGAVKSYFGTKPWYWSGMEMLILGGCCAAVAYLIGNIVDSLISGGYQL
mmetsp:Transcript_424/g.626  ORF Transcript_424/g.626 Transcript_424/m.626 type:complete len:310 (-) Transcript_424:228-1157(-)|eukprot:CAMPEP_0113939656 /NCGR_PEP_ID=MMETSP1339-20121228/5939_1 /TAXON_ID=94617 /ORGANISM="Fibrocapsa japonica" /LENGTH=309 /DNA_ID=CAMNT_0000943241 /DNA_START=208 /DNA_END=1137 /DNA_ORIENTATION=- /assembly_acc=CAM_ASM_000762